MKRVGIIALDLANNDVARCQTKAICPLWLRGAEGGWAGPWRGAAHNPSTRHSLSSKAAAAGAEIVVNSSALL